MDIASKVMNLQEAAKWRESLRASGRKLVGTNGVFDLLHRGHAEYLNQARQAGDALLVAVNSDASVKQLKGPTRPVVSEDDRAFLLASLQCVDAVVVFDNVRATEVWKAVCPDIYVKGGDYTEETLDREEYAVLKPVVEQFVFIKFVDGRSTTSTIRKVRGESVESTGTSGAGGGLNPKLNLLYGRRSVRRFQLRPVGDDLINDLLSAASSAPSACAKDPWSFIVLRSESSRKSVASCLPNGRFLVDAPLGIVVCGDLSRAHGGELSYLLQDCSAATENLLLAAKCLSLGGCWLGVHPRQDRVEALRKLFDLPSSVVPVAVVALGWPAEEPPARTRYRDDMARFV